MTAVTTMPAPMNERPSTITVKLCERCMLKYEHLSEFSMRRMQTVSGFKCAECGKHSSIGKVCEITVKRRPGTS